MTHEFLASFGHFADGVVSLGLFAGALFFLHAFRCSRDRFFIFLTASFLMMMVGRVAWGLFGKNWFEDPQIGLRTIVYGARCIAFLIIALGIIDKNTRFKRKPDTPKLKVLPGNRKSA